MTDLARGAAPAAPPPHPAPLDYLPGNPTTTANQAVADAQDALAAAEAAEAAAVRKVRIAQLLLDEVPADARASTRAAAEDKLETAAAAHAAAETQTRRALEAVRALDEQPRADDEPDADLAFPNADAWLRGWLLLNWRRPVEAQDHWCLKWWLHAEAVSRIEALWRAWEYLRVDGALGPSTWWRDHADYHLTVLTSSTGPFQRCNARRGTHQQNDAFPAVANPLNLAEFIAP